MPSQIIKIIQQSYPDILFRVETQNKVVALTIDDAPYSENTSELLDVLDKYNVKATFFVIGNKAIKYPKIFKRINDNHEVGNHDMDDVASIKTSPDQLYDRLIDVENIIGKTRYFRPGCGYFSQNMIDKLKHKWQMVLGDCYPHDPIITNKHVNCKYIMNKVSPGSIIIIHDRSWTPAMLDILLPALQTQGYRIGTITELLQKNANSFF